jgi:hypothetical protein
LRTREISFKAALSIGLVSAFVSLIALVLINIRAVFLQTALEVNLIAGLVTFAVAYSFLYFFVRQNYHSLVLGPIRRNIQFALSSIVIEKWDVRVCIEKDGNANVKHDFSGRVNFGKNRYVRIGIMAESEQPEKMVVKVVNMDTGREVKPEFLFDYPKYKNVRIHFDRVLERGDLLHYTIEYYVKKGFFFDCEDYYMQSATHYERKISIEILFPDDVVVERAWSEIITDQGDSWMEHSQPIFAPNSIKWTVEKACLGNRHYVRWTTKTKEK